ncbi:alpha/beta hydrolase family protein [Paenarthrobacter sp. NPDC057355]|uniref:alpha/beta hydrolase family protein n=1 Tax=Paenarthrobacter sp. NPDC057355 TaxID=3346105 RepID=UPI00363759ED
MKIISSALGAALIAALAGIVYALRLASASSYERKFDIFPVTLTEKSITLPSTKRTLSQGTFGLHLKGGGDPAIVGAVIRTEGGTVCRELLRSPTRFEANSAGNWSGVLDATPGKHLGPSEQVIVPTAYGPAPAWLVNQGTKNWAIHVHGHGSTRAQTLRGVNVASQLGLSSLVISYRNDAEGPAVGTGRHRFGETEWEDLEAALAFAKDLGAERCVIFGWSMGAALTLRLIHKSRMKELIIGVVLVAPVLSWREVLKANASHRGYPSALGRMVYSLLHTRLGSRVAGLGSPLDIRTFETELARTPMITPTLILHSRSDPYVPYASSLRFAETHVAAKLVTFDCPGHTQEWNAEPIRWEAEVRDWYKKL